MDLGGYKWKLLTHSPETLNVESLVCWCSYRHVSWLCVYFTCRKVRAALWSWHSA